MTVSMLSQDDYAAWDDYVCSHPKGSFYHLTGWKTIIENAFQHPTYYLICKQSGTLTGILPMVNLKSRIFGNILCSMPFLNYGGVLSDSPSAEHELLLEAIACSKKIGADYIELRQPEELTPDLDMIVKKHKVSMKLVLNPDADDIFERFSKKHRHELRRSFKRGLSFHSGGKELLTDFYEIVERGWKVHGTPLYSSAFFQHVLEELEKFIEIHLVIHNQKPVAAAMCGMYKTTVEGMWIAALPEYRKLLINDFLYWKMIERYCIEGFKMFHLGRSTKQSGNVQFKKKWNAEESQLYWEYILNKTRKLPELNVDNPKYRTVIKLWQKAPFKLTQKLGPYIAKYIP